MKHLLMIAVGGAGGALCRYGLVNLITGLGHSRFIPSALPLGTITVNVIGSFLIGIMYVLITEKLALHADWRSIAVVGFLGAFTTFSTFSLEAITLLENGQLLNALVYVGISVVVCVFATWLAMTLTRII